MREQKPTQIIIDGMDISGHVSHWEVAVQRAEIDPFSYDWMRQEIPVNVVRVTIEMRGAFAREWAARQQARSRMIEGSPVPEARRLGPGRPTGDEG